MKETLLMDGTFKTCPRQFYQMFTIFAMVGGYAFPAVFILMTRKTEELYKAVFEKIIELNPLFRPVRVMSDFESAPVNALRMLIFFTSTGCWFHFVFGNQLKVYKLNQFIQYREDEEVRK